MHCHRLVQRLRNRVCIENGTAPAEPTVFCRFSRGCRAIAANGRVPISKTRSNEGDLLTLHLPPHIARRSQDRRNPDDQYPRARADPREPRFPVREGAVGAALERASVLLRDRAAGEFPVPFG